MHKCKAERTQWKNYLVISLLNMIGKMYARILIDRMHKGIEGLNANAQKGSRPCKECVGEIFTLCEKRERKLKMDIGFKDNAIEYSMINMETKLATSY